jgi:hypothetical protein
MILVLQCAILAGISKLSALGEGIEMQSNAVGEQKNQLIVISVKLQTIEKKPVVGAFVAIDFNSGPRFHGDATDKSGATKIELRNPHYSVIVVKHEGKTWHFLKHELKGQNLELTLDDEHLFAKK